MEQAPSKAVHAFERTILASRGAGNKRQFARDILANNKMAWRFHSLVTCVPGSKPSEFFSVFLNPWGQLPVPSHSGEPIVSAILPKSPGEAIGHEYCRDPLWILEAELGRDAKLERIAEARRQDLVGNLEGEKGLRVQRRGHVDAGVISVGALEADIS